MTYSRPKQETNIDKLDSHVKPDGAKAAKDFFDRLEKVKRIDGSVLMRPTLNSRGHFVKRSICGSPKLIETTMKNTGTKKEIMNMMKK